MGNAKNPMNFANNDGNINQMCFIACSKEEKKGYVRAMEQNFL